MINIALNTLKEIIRNKFLSLIVVFAILMIIFSIALWSLTIWENQKVIIDFWIWMIEIFWVISVLFIWSQLLFKEIDWKTIFLLLSKPIKRRDFILWKFFWLALVISIITIFQSIVYLIVLHFNKINIDLLIIVSLFYILLKLITLIAIVLFLSSFMSTILSIISAWLVFILSQSFSIVIDMAKNTKKEMIIYFTKWVWLLFPPFEAINTKDYIWSFTSFSTKFYIANTGYCLVYIWLILMFCILIFNRKTFEN